jgi:WD40 repeat protein
VRNNFPTCSANNPEPDIRFPNSGSELLTLEGHSGMVKSVVWSPDSRRLASADPDALQIWNATEAFANQMAGSEPQPLRHNN